jgi:fucose permease
MTYARPAGERARIVVAHAGFALVGISASGGGVLIPAQLADYGIDRTTIGLMFLAFSAGFVTSAMASGSLTHRFGPRAYLVAGAGAMLIAWAGVGLRPPFALFIALQLLAGLGGGALEPALNTHLSGLDRPAVLLNSLHAFFGVGALLGPVIAGAVLSWGMRWTAFYLFFAALLVPLVIALLVLFPRGTVPDPGGGAPSGAAARPRLGHALRLRALWFAVAFLALYVGLEISLGTWGFSFLTEVREQPVLLASWTMSGYWAGLTAGRLVLARLADRVGLPIVSARTERAPASGGPQSRRRFRSVGLIACCLGGVAVGSAAVWLVPSSIVATAGLVLVGFSLGPLFPTVIAVVPRLVPAHLTGTAIGVLDGCSAAGGALAPFLAGAVAQGLGIWSLLPYGLVLTALLALAWRAIARRLGTPVPEAVAG